MSKTRQLATGCWLLASIGIAALPAQAQEKDCVSLKTEGQKEERYTDAQGKPATRLVALGKVLPGEEVVWTITASNRCTKPAEKVVVNNNVPQYMSYVADSAQGAAAITFSLNTRDFAKQSELTVKDASGASRPARADEIKAIRWVLSAPIAANQSVAVKYRARVN